MNLKLLLPAEVLVQEDVAKVKLLRHTMARSASYPDMLTLLPPLYRAFCLLRQPEVVKHL